MSRRPPHAEHVVRRALIAAAPLWSFLARLDAEVQVRARRSERSVESEIIRSVRDELRETLEAALTASMPLSVDAVAEASGRSRATVRRWCTRFGELCGATRLHGAKTWTIDLETFLAFAEKYDPMAAVPPRPQRRAEQPARFRGTGDRQGTTMLEEAA